MFIGFAGDAYKKENDVTLDKGQQVQLGATSTPSASWRERVDGAGQGHAGGEHRGHRDGKPYATMQPAKWSFPHHEEEPPTT